VTWVDLAARARGMAGHAAVGDELAILVRWAAERAGALNVILDDEDRTSLRALVRGLVAGAPIDDRVAAAVPTPRLPAAVLRTLARAPTPGDLAAELARLEHWAAPALAASDRDLFGMEQGLARAFAARARASAGADAALATHVAQVIDAENAAAALLLAARGRELDPAAHFLDGGTRVTREVFVATCGGELTRLAAALAGTPLAAALDGHGFADAALAWHIDTQARLRRLDPTGLAAVLLLLLSRRRDRRVAERTRWRAILGGKTVAGRIS
jgi:hypothetical protein